MLMAWGPFRFTIPNYSVETIQRSVNPRVETQPVIGGMPPVHRLGPGNEQITLQSTFFPQHFNGRGLAQLSAIRRAVNAQTPMMLTSINGAVPNVFGLWIGTGIEDEQTIFNPAGAPSVVSTTLTLLQDGGPNALVRGIALEAAVSLGGFSASVRIGF